MNEEIPYFNAGVRTPSNSASMQAKPDALNYDTLKRVKDSLQDAVDKIDNVRVFDLSETELSIKEQIAAYQVALSILEPELAKVSEAMNLVDKEAIKRNNGGKK